MHSPATKPPPRDSASALERHFHGTVGTAFAQKRPLRSGAGKSGGGGEGEGLCSLSPLPEPLFDTASVSGPSKDAEESQNALLGDDLWASACCGNVGMAPAPERSALTPSTWSSLRAPANDSPA